MKTKLYHVADEYFQILEDNNLNINNEVVWNKEEARPYFYILKAEKDILWLAPITSRYKEHLSNSSKYPDFYQQTLLEGRKGFMRLEKSIPVPKQYMCKNIELEIDVDLHQIQNKFNRILISKRNQQKKSGKVIGLNSLAILDYFSNAKTMSKQIINTRSNKLEYKDFQQLETELNAVKKSNYYICDCPKCQKHEAYIYESNLNVIHCNRQNECGENTVIKYTNQNRIINKELKDEKLLERKQLAGTYNILFAKGSPYEQVLRVDSYRGLDSKQVTDVYDINKLPLLSNLQEQVDVQGLTNLYKSQLSKFVNDGDKRNIIHLLRADDGTVERVLLRSNTADLKIKEKQVTLVENASGIFTHNLNQQTIMLCESHIDAMSMRSVNNELGYIALTGVNRTNQLFDYIDQNYDDLFNKRIIVAMDNDKAGIKASNKIRLKLEELGIINCTLRYRTKDKDLNDMLNNNIEKLKESVTESYSYISNIQFNDSQQKVRQTTKHINKKISLASLDSDELLKLTKQFEANPKLSIENHIICNTKNINSNNFLAASEVVKSNATVVNSGEPITGYHTNYIKGFFDGRQFKQLSQANDFQREQINDGQLNVVTKTVHYLRNDLYQIENNNTPRKQKYSDQVKMEGLRKFAKKNDIIIDYQPIRDDIKIDAERVGIIINSNLQIRDQVELAVDSLSHLLVRLENLDSRSNYSKRFETNINNILRSKLDLEFKSPISTHHKPLTTKQTKKIVYSSSKYSSSLQSTINQEARRQKSVNVEISEVR